MERIEFRSKWYEEQSDEIRIESYKFANDTVKKGDSLDWFSIFCGVFAIACFAIVLFFGIKNGMSDSMLFLLPVYLLIAIFSLCLPVQTKISEWIWNTGFKKRIAVNGKYDGKVVVTDEEVVVIGKKGEETYANYSECFFFETDSFIILNVDDHRLFPVSKTELEEIGALDSLRSLCINEEDRINAASPSAAYAPADSEAAEGEGEVEAEASGEVRAEDNVESVAEVNESAQTGASESSDEDKSEEAEQPAESDDKSEDVEQPAESVDKSEETEDEENSEEVELPTETGGNPEEVE